MPKGRKSQLPADKAAYLESFWPEFLELQPHLGNFWIKVVRGWLQNWPVERRLGFPLVDSTGAAIGEDARSPQETLAIGAAIVVRNWYNNRSQKEKKALNEATPASSSSGAVGEIIAALGGSSRQHRRSQRRQIWEKRNKAIINAALEAEGFKNLMGTGDDGETIEERKERVSRGRRAQQTLRQQIVKRLQLEATAEEMAIVEQLYQAQKKPSTISTESVRTPEAFQQGIDEVGPLLKHVHAYVEQKTGLVGGTMLVGPIPNLGGRIGTQTYCHGVTAAGHTFDQAHSGWEDQVVKPLHQFGKKVFDHQTRRERAIRTQESSELDNTTQSNTEEQTETGGSRGPADIPPSETPTSTSSENGPNFRLPTPPPISPALEAPPTASEPPSNGSPPRTSLFLPGEDEDFGQQDYPPLDLDLNYFPLSNETLSNFDAFSAPPNIAGTPGPNPLSMITGDTPSGDRVDDIMRSFSTTPPATTPAPANSEPAAAPPAPAPSGLTQNWIFPPHTSMPSTPTFGNPQRPAPASAPPPARPFASATALLAAGSVSVPSTPTRAGSTYGRPQTAFQRATTANPSPLRHVFTARSPSTPTPSAPSTTAPEVTPPLPAMTGIAPATTTTTTTPASTTTTTTTASTAPVLPSPHRHPAPPTAAAHAAPPVVTITTPVRVLSALTADDFPESRPLSNAPKAPKAATPAGQGRGGGRGGGARGRGTRGRGGRGRGRGGGGVAGGAGGGDADTGYLLGHDAEGGNRWQLGTVSTQRNPNREAAAAAAAAQKKLDRAARDRDHGVFFFPPPPPGTAPLPAEPAALGARAPPPEPRILGLRGASERTVKAGYVAPKKRTMEDIRKDAMKKKEQKAAEKLAAAAKRKADTENVRPGPSKKKRTR
ncbi:hypothetical protein R3P38DRAFT_3176599 [Favolaschia claudopus]|uniref:Uncharacterized protein n=1 Tax=Favolaschia claudopus TaxID=2862362 RepID=A0AAW0CYD0_9AGAR